MKSKDTGLSAYYGTLKTNIEKSNIRMDLSYAFEELNRTVLPIYSGKLPTEYDNKTYKITDALIKKGVKSYKLSSITTIITVANNLVDNESKILAMLDDNFNDITIKSVLDYRQLSILRYLESISTFNEYARRWLSAVIYSELETIDTYIVSPVGRANVSWVTSRAAVGAFVQDLSVLGLEVEDFLKSINSIKGYKFDKDDHTAIVNTTGRKVDPHLQNLFPVQWNPLYHIGKAVNGWRIAKHKRNIEDVKELQLMVLMLEEERSAKPDKATVDRLTKQIKYHTNRINILNGNIADMMEEGKDV